MVMPERLPTLWKVAYAVLLLPPPPAERVSKSEHDAFGDGDALDEQKGAIGAEDPQRAFDLAPPLKRQFAGDDFDELKICVRSRRVKGRVPPPSRDDNGESADERSALECAVAGRSPYEHHVSLHDWSTVGPPFQLGRLRATRFLIGDGKRAIASLRDNLEGSVGSRDPTGRCRGAARDTIEAGLN